MGPVNNVQDPLEKHLSHKTRFKKKKKKTQTQTRDNRYPNGYVVLGSNLNQY